MATNPLIPLMGKPFDLQNNLLKGEQIQALDQRTKQEKKLLPLRERLLKAQASNVDARTAGVEQTTEDRKRQAALRPIELMLESGELELEQLGAVSELFEKSPNVETFLALADTVPNLLDDDDREKFANLPPESFAEMKDALKPASLRELEANIAAANLDADDQEKVRRIALGLEPRAVGNANMTLAAGDARVTPEQVAQAAGTVRAGEAAGSAAIQASQDAQKQVSAARSTIAAIDKAIEAIDEGASSGVIQSFFPSIRESTLRLEQARNLLGLEIIGATTFGALSKGELDLALQTAVPDLPPAELKKWLLDKRAAQEKLGQEYLNAAIFLGTPGNTPAMYMQQLKEDGLLQFDGEKPGEGGGVTRRIRVDLEGNIIE